MKKILIIFFFNFLYFDTAFAETYYFKKCQLNKKIFADYIIDLANNEINVKLKTTDGDYQELNDKIKSVTKDQVVSEIIQSGSGQKNYFQYYLDAKSKSIIKLKYKMSNGILGVDGPKQTSYCADVKSDWVKNKKKKIEEEKKKKLKAEQEKEIIEAKKKKEAEIKKKEKEKNHRDILVMDNEWIKLSEAGNVSMTHLTAPFNERALDLCYPLENFDILDQYTEVIEMDETPAFGIETVVKFGMKGVVKCK